MVVPFSKARPGDDAFVYTCPVADEFGWVTDRAHFDDIDEPVTVRRQLWLLVKEETVTFHTSTELCPMCHGDGAMPTPAGVDVECDLCHGDGGHPLRGQMEVHREA